jgi:hypothetical protein
MLTLTPDELCALTGRKQPSKQVAWLTANGWRFALNANGRPVVARAYYERRMVAGPARATADVPVPDFAALER